MSRINTVAGSEGSLTELGEVLNERAIKYRRALITVNTAVFASFFLPKLNLQEAAPFGLEIGEYAWFIALVLIGYFGWYYWIYSKASYDEWVENFPKPEGLNFFQLIVDGETSNPREMEKEPLILKELDDTPGIYRLHIKPTKGKINIGGGIPSLRVFTELEIEYVKRTWRYFHRYDKIGMRVFSGVAFLLASIKFVEDLVQSYRDCSFLCF